MVSDVSNDHYAGSDHISTISGGPLDFLEFSSDGKMYYQSGTYRDTSSYFLTGDTKITIISPYYGNNTYDIKTLTSNSFIAYNKEILSGTSYSEETITLKR